MLEFAKGKEPACLAVYRSTPGANWTSVRGIDKQALRDAVCRDQGFLCVYCERRIRPEGSAFIEHWNPQFTEEEVFAWRNLLGVCSGHSGGERHCDKGRPANTLLFLQPVEGLGPSPRRYLKYPAGGKIAWQDGAPVEVQQDIERHLNLNARVLQRARREVFDQLRRTLDSVGFNKGRLRAELRRHTLEKGRQLPEQAELVRYHLERWLRKM